MHVIYKTNIYNNITRDVVFVVVIRSYVIHHALSFRSFSFFNVIIYNTYNFIVS